MDSGSKPSKSKIKDNHMDKFTRKTSFEQWFSPIFSTKLEELVETHQLNHYTKKLHFDSYLKLLAFAQLNEVESLRALSDTLFSDDLQRATALESISFSQLGRRLNQIPTEVFQQLFLDLVTKIHEMSHFSARRKATTPLKIIDSTTLPLNLNRHRWAEFRKTKSGVKLHLRLIFLEKGCSYPDKGVLTNAKQHDRGQLKVLVDDRECMYVFDRGYLDYEQFDRMSDDGFFFVSRLRKNAVIRVVQTLRCLEGSTAASDEMVLIGTTQNRAENVFRRIRVADSKGNPLELITNRFDIDADEIAELYRSRWAIELFFKWMKQHLNIKKFYGESEQAVHNQVYIAMIVYCLHVLAQLETNSPRSYLQISRWLRAALWKSANVWLRKIKGESIP